MYRSEQFYSLSYNTTKLSQDAHNQLNCLLAGSKDWIFINNTYNDWIYQAEEVGPLS